MIVYHGSSSNFKKLRISKSLVKQDSTATNEGYGIYFSTNIDVAKSYGDYLYKLEINDNYFKDFRNLNTCQRYINDIRLYIKAGTGIDIGYYVDLNSIAEYAQYGNIAIWDICREIYLFLDSNENWFNLKEYKIEKVYRMLRVYARRNLKAYMFTYNIKDIGVIKDVSEDVVRIIGKTKRR